MEPVFYAHVFHSVLMAAAIVFALLNIPALQQLTVYKKLKVILLFSILMGLHGLSHASL
jgi:hypothetical protein